MRIVHVSDCYLPRLGGIERQVHDLAARQQQQGHIVQIVTSTAGRSMDGPLDIVTRRPGPRRRSDGTPIRYEWTRRGRDAAISAVTSDGFDVVHIHASSVSPLAFLTAAASVRDRLPTVVTVHSLWAHATPIFRIANAALRWGEWPVAWSAVSSIAAGPLQGILGTATPVTILPNGADTWRHRGDNPGREADRVVIATVGRLSARKRPLQLVRMLHQARKRIPAGIQLDAAIVGDGPQRQAVQRHLDRHDMNQWVRLLGAIEHEQMGAFYGGADFYVAPAKLESFGIAALEARSAGLPVIAYSASGIADYVRHDVEGLLVDSDEEMISSIVHLATCRPTLDRIRRHNIDNAPGITWSRVLELTDAIYERARYLTTGRAPSESTPRRLS